MDAHAVQIMRLMHCYCAKALCSRSSRVFWCFGLECKQWEGNLEGPPPQLSGEHCLDSGMAQCCSFFNFFFFNRSFVKAKWHNVNFPKALRVYL